MLQAHARQLHCAAKCFLAELRATHRECRTLAACRELIEALAMDFEIFLDVRQVRPGKRGESRLSRLLTRGQLANKVRYLDRRRKAALEAVKQEKPERLLARRVADLWHVRAMLADAHLSPDIIAGICCEFTREESKSISSTQVGKVRDAFAEIIKDMQAKNIATHAAGFVAASACSRSTARWSVAGPTVYLAHIHDGADLRARSKSQSLSSDACLTMPRFASHMSRSRTSKIQNQKLDIHFGHDSFPWHSELQAMEDKTAASIATTIVSLISDVLRAFIPTWMRTCPMPKRLLRVTHGRSFTSFMALRCGRHPREKA